MATDFSNLLSEPVGSAKRPPVKPAGTYHGTIASYAFDESSKKKTPFVRFNYTNVRPGEDIDQEALRDPDGEAIDLAKWKPASEFYLTPEAMWRLDEFLEPLPNAKGRPKNEVIPELRGLPVILTVSIRPSEDGTAFFNRVEKVVLDT